MSNRTSRPQGIIPPYMLQRIIAKGSEPQRNCAQTTLNHVNTLLAHPFSEPMVSSPVQAGNVERTIYNAHNGTALPGTVVRKEDQAPTKDVAVNEAYDYLGDTYDFYWQAYKRNSLDAKGLPLLGTVHYEKGYQNAFWNGQQMVFGDGDGEIFNRFTIAIDVIGHELTHGVTETEVGLVYFQQSGALNESLSDVFGSMVKQFHLKQTAKQADWIIGEGLLAKGINGIGLRSMSHPGSAYDDPLLGKDPQPASMTGYVQTKDDNGGVHLNSGIPNRAFYLAAIALGGNAWEHAGYVWYDTLCDKTLPQDAGFATFANLTVAHAQKRFDAKAAQAVKHAWHQVGVL